MGMRKEREDEQEGMDSDPGRHRRRHPCHRRAGGCGRGRRRVRHQGCLQRRWYLCWRRHLRRHRRDCDGTRNLRRLQTTAAPATSRNACRTRGGSPTSATPPPPATAMRHLREPGMRRRPGAGRVIDNGGASGTYGSGNDGGCNGTGSATATASVRRARPPGRRPPGSSRTANRSIRVGRASGPPFILPRPAKVDRIFPGIVQGKHAGRKEMRPW